MDVPILKMAATLALPIHKMAANHETLVIDGKLFFASLSTFPGCILTIKYAFNTIF